MKRRRTVQTTTTRWGIGLVFLLALPLAAADSATRTVTDQTGRTIAIPARLERVITLAPNLTEIVYALGQQHRLVAVTNQCNYPPAVSSKARVGDVVNPNLERIIELKPDLVFGSTTGNRRETVDLLDRADIPLFGVDARTVEGILVSIQTMADLLGVPQNGEHLVAGMETQLASLQRAVEGSPRPTVLLLIWVEPVITTGADTFLADVIRTAGARSISSDLDQDWPRLSMEAVIERDPDFLVLPRTHLLQEKLARLVRQSPWSELRAVRENRIVWLDEALIRPGPRILEVIEDLAQALHPQLVQQEASGR